MTVFVKCYDTVDHDADGISPTYTTARSTNSNAYPETDPFSSSGQGFDGTNYTCLQWYLSFDTSPIQGFQVISASLNATVGSAMGVGGETHEVREHSWTTGAGAANWVPGASLAGKVLFGSAVKPIALSVDGTRFGIPADPTVLKAFPNPYKVVMFGQNQRLSVAPTGNEFENFFGSDTTGTAYDAFLLVEISPGAEAFPNPTAQSPRRYRGGRIALS